MIDGQRGTASPDPEVTPKAKRRIFAAAYKKKILAEMDAAAGSGQIGELLRREGIYSSTLTRWRRERDNAVDSAFSQKRGPEAKTQSIEFRERKTAAPEPTSAGRSAQSRTDHRGSKKSQHAVGSPCCHRVPTAGTPDGGGGRTQFRGGCETRLSGSFRSSVGGLPAPPAPAFSAACGRAADFRAPFARRGEVGGAGLPS